ncbi:MAG: hypothetical protein ACETWG_09080 [Candidatus Neomarinimicrobiota bacterium]
MPDNTSFTNIDLEALERGVWQSTFQDGLWDLFIGVFALGFAVTPLINDVLHSDFWSTFSYLPVNLGALLLLFLGKRYITAPRIGRVRYRSARRRRLTALSLINVVIFLIGGVVGAIAAVGGRSSMTAIHPYFFGLVILAVFSLCAYLLNVQRFYIYGILLVTPLLIGEASFLKGWKVIAFHHGFPVTFGLSALIIITTGITLLVRFIEATPVPVEEPIDAPQ